MSNQQPAKKTQRPTEPLPDTAKPALRFLAFLGVVVAFIAIAAVIVDRMIYG
jgi:hypothetical protein